MMANCIRFVLAWLLIAGGTTVQGIYFASHSAHALLVECGLCLFSVAQPVWSDTKVVPFVKGVGYCTSLQFSTPRPQSWSGDGLPPDPVRELTYVHVQYIGGSDQAAQGALPQPAAAGGGSNDGVTGGGSGGTLGQAGATGSAPLIATATSDGQGPGGTSLVLASPC